jgi:ABC-type sugar transport system permease subunit
VLWLVSAVIATPFRIGLLLAILLDQNIRGTCILPEHLLRTGDALARATLA